MDKEVPKTSTPFERADGVTRTERYLKTLADRSFLSMWSYSRIFRDQRGDGVTEGKELCDLLVVFENHIIIFSDKDCTFPNTGDLRLDWSRWYRRAVANSAKQIWGAERWIKTHPERLFLDRACTQPFPIDLPDPETATFHRVLIAHGVAERCRRELGGSGSLGIIPGIVGRAHTEPVNDKAVFPFFIGQVDPAQGYLHVLDDTTLSIVMRELDTITDFVTYLSRKEQFILSGQLISAGGEEDLLAHYLSDVDEHGTHCFEVGAGFNGVMIGEGTWAQFQRSPERRSRIEADEISYAWDHLIERFSQHMREGTHHLALPNAGVRNGEKILRFLARENRMHRRALATALIEVILATPDTDRPFRRARFTISTRPGEPYYVFLVLNQASSVSYEEYRQIRYRMLVAHCQVLKLKVPEALDIVGIAVNAGRDTASSEDALYFDARHFSEDDRREAQEYTEKYGFLSDESLARPVHHHVWEYPFESSEPLPRKMKGRNRNETCPCGSGRKYKHCHGR